MRTTIDQINCLFLNVRCLSEWTHIPLLSMTINLWCVFIIIIALVNHRWLPNVVGWTGVFWPLPPADALRWKSFQSTSYILLFLIVHSKHISWKSKSNAKLVWLEWESRTNDRLLLTLGGLSSSPIHLCFRSIRNVPIRIYARLWSASFSPKLINHDHFAYRLFIN